jgi:hypothetical protein
MLTRLQATKRSVVLTQHGRGTAVVSPGYFAQQGQWPLVGMFAVLLALAVVSIVKLLQSGGEV